ncbi:voltage-dependent calcium channel gamma-8 subunit [Amphiprion ocellaris]|uniref:voltage-dependent calcium channel gamma-8 subunit n=1 Tax=Amphiprion ocellaris TaxID=80972 RepID=UPI00241151CA|nr:voltage-dependent calcium channel gamma-8 subunit [Amphiprion ocellaris]
MEEDGLLEETEHLEMEENIWRRRVIIWRRLNIWRGRRWRRWRRMDFWSPPPDVQSPPLPIRRHQMETEHLELLELLEMDPLWRFWCQFRLLGLSNIIGVIVYISAALGDISPKKDEDKKWQYSYGWSFYFGGLSFIMAEMVGVLAVNIYIEKNKELRCRSRTDIFKSTTHAMLRLPSYRFRRRSRSSSRSTDPSRSRDPSPVGGSGGKNFGLPPSALLSQGPISVSTLPNPHSRSHTALAGGDISLYTLSRDPKLGGLPPMYGTVDRATLYQLHNCFPKDSGAGGGVMMSGTLPSLKSHNPSNSSNSNTPMPNSVGSGPPPFTSSTVDRERGMGTLDRLKGDRESNSNTLNRKTTPV